MSKLVKACIGLAAFVALAVVPASAFGFNDPLVVEQSNTQKLEVGHGVNPEEKKPIPILATLAGGTSATMTSSTGGILVNCTTATLTGELETNTGTGPNTGTVEGTITTADFNGPEAGHKCTSGLGGPTQATTTFEPEGNGIPYCIRSTGTMATHEFQVRGGSCTKEARPITFVLDTTNIGKCNYIRNAAIPGTYTTHPNDAVLTVTKAVFTREAGSGVFCPAEGLLDMSFTLTTDTPSEEPLSILNQ